MGSVVDRPLRESAPRPLPVVATRLEFRYGRRAVLAGLDLQTRTGERLGIVGPNGAGKSTLLALLAGLLPADSGALHWFGLQAMNRAQRRRIGFLPDQAALFDELTGFENLALFSNACGRANGGASPAELLGLTEEQLAAAASTYSFGMRRKLALAQTLMGPPELLLLDEPTIGLDPEARERLATILRSAQDRSTVILASNDLPFVEQHCERVLFLFEGHIVLDGAPASLLAPYRGHALFQVQTRDPFKNVDLPSFQVTTRDETSVLFQSNRGTAELPLLIEALLQAGNQIESIAVKPADLTHVFRQVTGSEWTSP